MKRKIALIMILLAVILSTALAFVFGDAPKTFSDLEKDHWAFESVERMKEIGIISGYPGGDFKPDAYITYAEFIKMVTVAKEVIESDLKPESIGHWAKPYYNAALNNMYFTKWDISEGALDIPIPRKHMALIAGGAMGEFIKIEDYGDYDEISGYISDVDYKTPYEYEIVKSYATGILSGYPDGSFRPEGVLTRAEAVSVVDRLRLMNVKKDPGTSVPLEEPVKKLENGSAKAWVEVDEELLGYPEGSYRIIVRNYGEDTKVQHNAMLTSLKEHCPNETNEIVKVAAEFSAKPTGKSDMGIRKQYFGQYPVLMNRYGATLDISIFPIGYSDEYWDTEPGQIKEYLF